MTISLIQLVIFAINPFVTVFALMNLVVFLADSSKVPDGQHRNSFVYLMLLGPAAILGWLIAFGVLEVGR
jgi:uncharacterized membrane protein